VAFCRVAAADYLAGIAYRSVFDCDKIPTGLHVREELRKVMGGTVTETVARGENRHASL
jgi:hypothetical protein